MGGELSRGGDIRGVGSAAPRGDRNYRYILVCSFQYSASPHKRKIEEFNS